MKRLNQTETPIFVILCVLCFQLQSFFTFLPLLFYYKTVISHDCYTIAASPLILMLLNIIKKKNFRPLPPPPPPHRICTPRVIWKKNNTYQIGQAIDRDN